MLYSRIKALCDEKKISVYNLEKTAGLSNGAVGKWKVSMPSADKLSRVADILGVTVDDLLRK